MRYAQVYSAYDQFLFEVKTSSWCKSFYISFTRAFRKFYGCYENHLVCHNPPFPQKYVRLLSADGPNFFIQTLFFFIGIFIVS
jgi:hypothetical protein